jgi:hypothetical protein
MGILFTGPFLALVVYGLMKLRATRDWEGVWKWLGVLPKVAIAADVAFIAVGVTIDPTSHNLWPLELLMVATLAIAFLGAVALLHRWTHET